MKKWLALGMIFTMLLALVGCGGNKDTASSAAAAAPASTSASAQAEPAASATGESSIDKIKASGKLVMLTNGAFPPYEYMDGENVVGVDQELAQKVADELGVELEIVNMNFDLLIAALQSGKGDLVAAGMSITDERKEEVDFSVPYVDSTLLIIVPAGSEIAGPDDLAGKVIAVQENTTSDLYVSDTVDAKDILRFKSPVDAGSAVMGGKADVAVIDEMTALNIVNANEGNLVLLEEPLGKEQYAMAVNKGNEDLLAVVDKVLQESVDNGEVEDLIAKHMELSA